MESEFYDSLNGESDEPPETPDDIIPFYDRSISRSEIDLGGNACTTRRGAKKTSRRRSIDYGGYKLKSVSYLDMFQKRSAAYCRDRSFESDSNSYTNSYTTCNEYEGESFYLNSDSSCDNHSTLRENPDLFLLMTNTDSKKMRIVQEQKNNVSLVKKPTVVKRTYSKINSNKLPEMGRLGPEIPTDKLEIFRKRQQYGKKVSLTNGIKMKEKKALRSLKQEIMNSKNVFI